MTHRLLYIVGAPGSGKSTLMARLTEDFERVPWESSPINDPFNIVPSHDELFHDGEPIDGCELGVQRGLFSGTDALPSSVIDKAVPWLAERPYQLIMGEGARLANKWFLTAARDAGYAITLVHLDHPDIEAWRKKRTKAIGREQNASWVKGRATASANLAEWAVAVGTVVTGSPDAVFEQVRSVIFPT